MSNQKKNYRKMDPNDEDNCDNFYIKNDCFNVTLFYTINCKICVTYKLEFIQGVIQAEIVVSVAIYNQQR